MGWQAELRKAGYDPKKVRDAKHDRPFSVEFEDQKGAIIGEGTACTAARGCNRSNSDVVWSFFGATVAILVLDNGKIERYIQKGSSIAQMQDNLTMVPPGDYVLKAPKARTERLGSSHATTQRNGSRPTTGRRLSAAAALRR